MQFFHSVIAALLLLTAASVQGLSYYDKTWIPGDTLPDSPVLAARGPYYTCYSSLSVTNPGQFNFATGNISNRVLPLSIWLPTQKRNNVSDFVWQGPSIFYSFPIPTFFASYTGDETLFYYPGRSSPLCPLITANAPFPLVILSHGLPGKRELWSYLGESLASQGFAVVAIDHAGSLWTEAQDYAFPTSLYYRREDIFFVLNSIANLTSSSSNTFWLKGKVSVENTTIVGFSFGGYGALLVAGATLDTSVPSALGISLLSSLTVPRTDPRVKGIVTYAPFGQGGTFNLPELFNVTSLKSITLPTLVLGGTEDDIAGYSGIRRIFGNLTSAIRRNLISFTGARHNIALNPNPSYIERDVSSDDAARIGDYVWDKRKLNNIGTHFINAFINAEVLGKVANRVYFTNPTSGFPDRAFVGITVE